MHMARLYEPSPLMVSVFDDNDMLRYGNPAFADVFRIDPTELLSWSDLMRRSYSLGYGAVIQTNDIEAWLIATRARRGKQPYRTFEADLPNGRWIHMTETVDEQGWMSAIAFDVTELRVNQRSLRVARDDALRAAQVDAASLERLVARLLEQVASAVPGQSQGAHAARVGIKNAHCKQCALVLVWQPKLPHQGV